MRLDSYVSYKDSNRGLNHVRLDFGTKQLFFYKNDLVAVSIGNRLFIKYFYHGGRSYWTRNKIISAHKSLSPENGYDFLSDKQWEEFYNSGFNISPK